MFIHIYVVARNIFTHLCCCQNFLHICVVARNISCTLSLMPTLSDHWSLSSTRTNVSSVRYNKQQLDILLFATHKNFGCTSTLAHYAVFNSCTLIFSVLCFAWCFSAFLFFISFAKFPNWCEMQLLFGFPFLVMVGRSGISTSPLATPPTWAMSLFASLPIPDSVFFLFYSFSISQFLHQN